MASGGESNDEGNVTEGNLSDIGIKIQLHFIHFFFDSADLRLTDFSRHHHLCTKPLHRSLKNPRRRRWFHFTATHIYFCRNNVETHVKIT